MRRLLSGWRRNRACRQNSQLLADYLRALDDSYAAHRPYIKAYLANDFGGLHQCRRVVDQASETVSDARERLMQGA
jgi:hypothetical protein